MTRCYLVLVLGLVALFGCDGAAQDCSGAQADLDYCTKATARVQEQVTTLAASLDECTSRVHELEGPTSNNCTLAPVPTPAGAHEFDGVLGSHYATNCRPKCKVGHEASQLHVMGGDPDPTTIASVWVAENVQTPGESITWRLDRLGEPSRWTEPLKDRADCLASINDHVAVYVLVGTRGVGGDGYNGVTHPFNGTIGELLVYMNATAIYAAGDRVLPLSDANSVK